MGRATFVARSSPSLVMDCSNFYLTEVSLPTLMNVMTRRPAFSWMWMQVTAWPEFEGNTAKSEVFKVSSPYISCRTFPFIVADADSRPWTPTYLLWYCTTTISLLPALFNFFLEGINNWNIASNPKLHRPGVGMKSSSSLSASESGKTSAICHFFWLITQSISVPEASSSVTFLKPCLEALLGREHLASFLLGTWAMMDRRGRSSGTCDIGTPLSQSVTIDWIQMAPPADVFPISSPGTTFNDFPAFAACLALASVPFQVFASLLTPSAWCGWLMLMM